MHFSSTRVARTTLLNLFIGLLATSPAFATGTLSEDFGNSAGPQVNIDLVFEPGPKPIVQVVASPIIPTGVGERTPRPDCQARDLEGLLIETKGDTKAQAETLNSFFARCEEHLARFGQHSALSLQRLDRVKYNFAENPAIREIKITTTETYQNGFVHRDITRGILAMQPDARPRPLLLIICGLFCSASDSALFRNLLMHGLDESPFHVVVLNSNTSAEYLMDNARLATGGVDEGRNTVQIARWLRNDSPFKNLISSLHVVGVSNGGNAALYAAAYGSKLLRSHGTSPVNSVAALCPVVDVKPSLDFLFQRSLVRQVFYRKMLQTMQEVRPEVPVLQRLVDMTKPPTPEKIGEVIGEAAVDYYARLPMDWLLPPFTGTSLQAPADFWSANLFSNFSASVSLPTLIWAPKNDSVVNYADNTAKLLDANGNPVNGSMSILASNYGNHCGFSLAYGWDTVSAIFRAHVLANSPEFQARRQENIHPIQVPAPTLAVDEVHLGQEWIVTANSPILELRYRVFNPNGSPSQAIRCGTDPFEAPFVCISNRSVRVPMADLGIPDLMIAPNVTQAEVLTRKLNSTVTLLDANKQKITNSTAAPAFIHWWSY